jgi:hypothetical protein
VTVKDRPDPGRTASTEEYVDQKFTGQPLITATRFEREALRRAKCQQRYVAPLLEGVRVDVTLRRKCVISETQ